MQTERDRPSTSADDVRKAIRQLEIGVVNYRGRGKAVLDLLAERDQVEAGLAALEGAGLDVRPERTRLAFVDGKIEQYSRKLIREMGGSLAVAGLVPSVRLFGWLLPQFFVAAPLQRLRRFLPTVRMLEAVRTIVYLLLAVLLAQYDASRPGYTLPLFFTLFVLGRLAAGRRRFYH